MSLARLRATGELAEFRQLQLRFAQDEARRLAQHLGLDATQADRAFERCEDFLEAWYPDRGFGVPVRGPINAISLTDDRQILTVAFVDLPDRASLEGVGERIAAQEAARHDRIDEVIESTELRAIYEQLDEFDFSTDESVARTRPAR